MCRLTFCLLVVALAAAPPALARQAEELEQVESLIEAGDYAQARARLERWAQANDEGHGASPGERARALLLRARLASDAGTAEKDYLTVALGYPTSPYAPLALLTLGQGLLASGDIDRAILYLQRLVDDYPGSPHRLTGRIWLARALRLDGHRDAACHTARNGLQSAADAVVLSLLRHEEQVSCSDAPDSAGTGTAGGGVAAADSPTNTADRPGEDGATTATGRFAVQSGAFRQASGAEALAERLGKAGYDARIIRVPGSGLLRVRTGRFPDSAAAQALSRRLQAAGFPAVVVGDADKEIASTQG